MEFRAYKKLLFVLAVASLLLTACFNDLDTVPLDEDEVTSATVYDTPSAYRQVLAKLYAGLSVSGQQGPAGKPDISGIDEGFSTYIRQYWKAQELSTDEAVIAWNDGNIHDYHEQDWDANNEFITAMYNRIFYQISLCNEFLRETTDSKLDGRNVDAGTRADVAVFRAEARFLRSLSYWHALDMFRNVPFVTEDDKVGAFFPDQISAENLYNYIESELTDIEDVLVDPRQNEYGRADKAAAWILLAKLYINAQTYVGKDANTECITYCQKVIDAGYQLDENYEHLFLADNNTTTGLIFPVTFDGISTRTWGGMTFVLHAAVGGSMPAADFGLDGGWGGIRTTSALVEKFPSTGGSIVVAPNPGGVHPVVYVPGSYQGWDPANESTVLGSVNDDGTYEGYFNFVDADTKFKITTGPNWDVNFGDDNADGKLEPGGGDITAAEAGFYRITVDLNDSTYTAEKTEWGVIGSATPGGWDSDTDMTFDEVEGAWTLTTQLTVGEIKFRANDDWGINYGDTGADALLDFDGTNITISEGSTYIIKLYLDNPDHTYSIEKASFDTRAMFYTDGQSLEINDVSQFTEGYAITKYKNIDRTGAVGTDLTFPDTDFPMFRLADAYLMYAEAVVRGGSGGDRGTAVQYVNAVKERAFGDAGGNITDDELTLDFLLDERAREFYWECQRRTDLIRFGQFSDGDYLWPLKGGVPEGRAVSAFRDVFPIPSSDIGANPNLDQNDGY